MKKNYYKDVVNVGGVQNTSIINLAKKKKIQLALIDQDIEITLKRLSQELSQTIF